MSLFQIAKSIFLVLAIWMISIPAVFACSCICDPPKTPREKYEAAQERLAEADYALTGLVTNIGELNASEATSPYYEITISPIKLVKGDRNKRLTFRYYLRGPGMCGPDHVRYKVGETVSMLGNLSLKDNSVLIWQNGACDCNSYYVFNDGGPLSKFPMERRPACVKRPVLSYRCLVD